MSNEQSTVFLKESYKYTTNYKPCWSVEVKLGVVLVTEEDITCTHSFTMKAYEEVDRVSDTIMRHENINSKKY